MFADLRGNWCSMQDCVPLIGSLFSLFLCRDVGKHLPRLPQRSQFRRQTVALTSRSMESDSWHWKEDDVSIFVLDLTRRCRRSLSNTARRNRAWMHDDARRTIRHRPIPILAIIRRYKSVIRKASELVIRQLLCLPLRR